MLVSIGDRECGTAGFLIAASEHLIALHSGDIYKTDASRKKFNSGTFHGYDFGSTMLRIGSMNMLLHFVENPDIRYRDSLAQSDQNDAERFTLVLANPPFAGSLEYESTDNDLLQVVKTEKTELLFRALFLRLLQTGGRAAVIVPDGVLFGSSTAHKALRKMLVEDHNSTASSPCRPACSNRTPASPPPSCSSPRRTPAAPTTSGSTTFTPTAFRSTTSAPPSPTSPTCPTSLMAGTTGRRRRAASASTRASSSPSPNWPPRTTTSPSTATRGGYEAVEYDSPKVILSRLAKLEEEIEKGRLELEGLLK